MRFIVTERPGEDLRVRKRLKIAMRSSGRSLNRTAALLKSCDPPLQLPEESRAYQESHGG